MLEVNFLVPEVDFGWLWTPPTPAVFGRSTVGAVLPSCPPPPAGIAAIHEGCAQSDKHHAEARGPQLHRWGPSAPISDIHYPEHVCTWLYANQPEQLLLADNPELLLAKRTAGRALFLRRAWGSGEEGAGNSHTELLPSFQGGVAGGLPKGRLSGR